MDANPRTPEAERILKESESLLMYGQLDASMELLEDSIKKYRRNLNCILHCLIYMNVRKNGERLQKYSTRVA